MGHLSVWPWQHVLAAKSRRIQLDQQLPRLSTLSSLRGGGPAAPEPVVCIKTLAGGRSCGTAKRSAPGHGSDVVDSFISFSVDFFCFAKGGWLWIRAPHGPLLKVRGGSLAREIGYFGYFAEILYNSSWTSLSTVSLSSLLSQSTYLVSTSLATAARP